MINKKERYTNEQKVFKLTLHKLSVTDYRETCK